LSQLVRQAQAGDPDAFGQIVVRFQDMAFAVAYAMLGDFASAQDAAQDAFIEAYLSLHALREPAAFPAWFRRVVVKHGDRQARRQRPGVPFDDALETSSGAPDPAGAVEAAQLRRALQSALASLPPLQRQITTLFYLDGYSQRELVSFLDLPLATIKKQLFTARGRLRQRMDSMLHSHLQDNRPSQTDAFANKVQFFIALKAHDLRRLKALVEAHPGLLDARLEGGAALQGYYWPTGFSALHWAAATGDAPLLSYLLGRMDVNVATPGGLTPLHVAVLMNQPDAVHSLLEAGAAVDAASKNGHTALHLAAMRNNPRAVELLLAREATSSGDSQGRTPLDWAVLKNAAAAIGLLAGPPRPHSPGMPGHEARAGQPATRPEAARPRPAAVIFETGLKIVDLLAPFRRGGHNGVFTPRSGLGKMVVLNHLIYVAAASYGGQAVWAGIEDGPFNQDGLKLSLREWGLDEKMTTVFVREGESGATRRQSAQIALAAAKEICGQAGEGLLLIDSALARAEAVLPLLQGHGLPNLTLVYFGQDTLGAEPEPFDALDAAVTFDASRARQGLWPAIDPIFSRSSLLRPDLAGAVHESLARRARRLMRRYMDLPGAGDPQGFEMLKPDDQRTVIRARRLERFLTQPLSGAEPWTNVPGEIVSLAETLEGARAILDGEHDLTAEEALYFIGALAAERWRG
jgi:F-type H+-transporting ATPase subunit beta